MTINLYHSISIIFTEKIFDKKNKPSPFITFVSRQIEGSPDSSDLKFVTYK